MKRLKECFCLEKKEDKEVDDDQSSSFNFDSSEKSKESSYDDVDDDYRKDNPL